MEGDDWTGWVWVPREKLARGLDAADGNLARIRWWDEWGQDWEAGITSEPGVRYEVLMPPDHDRSSP